MDCAFDLASVGGVAAAGCGVVRAVNRGDIAVRILLDRNAGDKIGITETHLFARSETVELPDRLLHEVGGLNVKFFGERDFAGSGGGIFRVVDGVHFLHKVFRIVVDHQLDRIHHRHVAVCGLVQFFADAVVQKSDVREAVELGDADFFAEVADRGSGNAAAAVSADGRHARIIPVADVVFLDKLQEFALAHDRIGQIQACELGLLRMIPDFKDVEEPVVKRTVDFKFECADGVRNAFD